MSARVRVSAPSRLHFGLLRFEQPEGRSYGGLGMMLQSPRVELEIEEASHWGASGPDAERALEAARRALDAIDAPQKPTALHVRIDAAIPSHHGLGAGTQLALSVAAGVGALLGAPPHSAAELATIAGRGRRSAVGSHGFEHGGLIWEVGKLPGEALGGLRTRLAVPEAWRVVLTSPNRASGLSGGAERQAFESLPPPPEATVGRLRHLAEECILPAAEQGSFDAFGRSVYEYGRLSGECFASVQGGAYASEDISRCVAAIRQLGVQGVGQSSWGPTVFAVTEDQEQAEWLQRAIDDSSSPPQYQTHLAAPDNQGALIQST